MNHFPVPTSQQVPLRGTAEEFIEEMNAQMIVLNHSIKPDQAIRIIEGGSFGMIRPACIP